MTIHQLHDPRTYRIIGAAMEVHRILHRGLLEQIYCEALAVEFDLLSIPFATQVPFQVVYKERRLSGFHRIDFVCFEDVVVEVKASSLTGPAEQAQVLNYLALSGHRLGLLLNFGRPSLEYKRFVLDQSRPE
jgi:GxxExxY protein